jgi:hypothetical protein
MNKAFSFCQSSALTGNRNKCAPPVLDQVPQYRLPIALAPLAGSHLDVPNGGAQKARRAHGLARSVLVAQSQHATLTVGLCNPK